jgi:hypothetical protein
MGAIEEETRLLTEEETASLFRLSRTALRRARNRGEGPDYVRIGPSILYHRGTVLRYVTACCAANGGKPRKLDANTNS